MERKKVLAITVFAVSLGFSLIAFGIRGGVFQSSLLGSSETGSGQLSINFGSGILLQEFPLDEERNLMYTLLVNDSSQKGFYFPKVYKVKNNSQGLLGISLRTEEFVSIEQKLSLQIKFPQTGVVFIGNSTIVTENFKATAQVIQEEGILNIEVEPLDSVPILLEKELENIFMLPFKIALSPQDKTELRFRVLSAFTTKFTGEQAGISHIDIEGEMHLDTTMSTSSGAGLSAPTTKPYTGELPTPKKTVTTAPWKEVTLKNVPEITLDNTMIMPSAAEAASGQAIYVYVTVKDKDGLSDLDKVVIDLSPFGLAKENRLLEIGRNSTYVEYMTNFVLPNGVLASTIPYILTYKVYDKENHVAGGAFSFLVMPGKKRIEVDLNNDGVVDIKDMTLYINAYQQAAEQ